MELEMDVSVIIVNYNTSDHLRNCICSIEAFTKNRNYEIIVVDNNSPERDVEQLAAEHLSVKFCFRKVNDGFGAACNIGAKISRGRYLLFVNPDIVFHDDVLAKFIDFMDRNKDAVLASGLMENEKGELIYSYDKFPTLRSDLRITFRCGYDSYVAKLTDRKEISERTPFMIDYALGALLFVRRNAFSEINGFDKRFFLYSEDVDFGLRISKLGKSYCVPDVRVFHFYNSSVKKDGMKYVQVYNLNRSFLIFMYKHYGFWRRLVSRCFIIVSILLRLLYLPVNRVHKGSRVKNFLIIFKSMTVFFRIYNLDKM
jgi:O-antigen biosynthesis protein